MKVTFIKGECNLKMILIKRRNGVKDIGVQNVGIIGLGLIGGSIAKAIKAHTDYRVIGYDIDQEILKQACDLKAIDHGETDVVKTLEASDFVIICLYPFETINFIKKHYNDFKEKAIVMDTAGLKEEIVSFFYKMVYNDRQLEFIGGHPMAGSEKSGFAHSKSDLFEGATFILTPHDANKDETLEFLEGFIHEIGFESLIKMKASEHDQTIATISHLPHLIASALLKQTPSVSFYGGSYRDVTRVGKMNTTLWQELVLNNQANVLRSLEQFDQQISALKNAIETRDAESLEALLTH